jgi:hypothetical protein
MEEISVGYGKDNAIQQQQDKQRPGDELHGGLLSTNWVPLEPCVGDILL